MKLTFDDVLIVPKFSNINSRSEVDLSVNPRGMPYLKLPILSANMDTVTGPKMAQAMILAGAQAVLPRFGSIDDNVKAFQESVIGGTGSIQAPMVSLGLGDHELLRAKALMSAGASTFVIDVAHGAQLSVVEQVQALRKIIGHERGIIVGNFATGASVEDFLQHFGCDIDGVKVGIGPGSACTTRIKTGVGYPQLSAIMDVVKSLKNYRATYGKIKVIADGGMRTAGDIAKAIGAGAHLVMLGGMLAGTEESPGEIVYFTESRQTTKDELFAKRKNADGTFDYVIHSPEESFYEIKKKYRGSASQESYLAQGKTAKHRTTEGESFLVPFKGPVANILQDIEGGLRSAMTYVGARSIEDFQSKCEFVEISPSTVAENGAHGKRNA
jgi:IMP dehydrogenase